MQGFRPVHRSTAVLPSYPSDLFSFPCQQTGDTSSVWTLGYLLNLTNSIPQDSPSFLKGIDPGVWSLLLILFVVLLTGSFMRISYRVMVKENSFSNRNSSVFDDNWLIPGLDSCARGQPTEYIQKSHRWISLEDAGGFPAGLESLSTLFQLATICTTVHWKNRFCHAGSLRFTVDDKLHVLQMRPACTDLAWAATAITCVNLMKTFPWGGGGPGALL